MRLSVPFLRAHKIVLVTVVGAMSGPAVARQVYKAESKVEISGDGSAGRIRNRTLEVISHHPEPRRRLLLQKEIQQTFQDDEPGHGEVRIDAWQLPRLPNSKPLYSIVEPGDEIGWFIYPLLLKIRIEACCDSSGSYTIFNAATGKMLVYANGGDERVGSLATVSKTGGSILMIGTIDEHGGRRPAIFPKHGHGIPLLITTADESMCRGQLLFNFPVPSNRMATYLRSVTWEGQKVGRRSDLQIDLGINDKLDATLKVVLSDGRALLLPVRDEGIESGKVVLPNGVTMTAVSPCKL